MKLCKRFVVGVSILLSLAIRPSDAYSVLSHEEVVDMAWKDQIVPLLKARYPGISDDDVRQAHAYAYGGSVIQDIGYYPFGAKYFSDLLHYVRPNEFVEALIRDSRTPDEYAFALGALAHFCGDTVGHPTINQVTADENAGLRRRFGRTVTYAEDPTAHLRTEFGFDVVEVAQGHYSQQDYHDYIGFQVAKPLLERAFLETYGIPVSSVIKHEDLAIKVYRDSVSTLIPKFTRIAFVSYKGEIQRAAPGAEKSKFIYQLNKTEYRTEFGKEHVHVSVGGRIAAFFLHLVPKVGPFRALKLTLPNAQEQASLLQSINASVSQCKTYLEEIHASPMQIPAPSEQDVAASKKAADKVASDANRIGKEAAKDKDPADKQAKEKEAAKLKETAEKAAESASRTAAMVTAAVSAAGAPGADDAASSSVSKPRPPTLPELDLDTGRKTAFGEYPLADDTYAHLLKDLVTPTAPSGQMPEINVALGQDIEAYFANRKTQADQGRLTEKEKATRLQQMRQVTANLATLKAALTAAQSQAGSTN